MDNAGRMDRVRAYYASFGQREWNRLDNPADGAIELELTQRALLRHLTSEQRILDVGGGPGRYAIWLAERGHDVVLADLSPKLLAIGRERSRTAGAGLEDVRQADARDLSQWSDASFDAVLELGPFYHLQSPGAFDNDVGGRFDHGYGARPEEIDPYLSKHGFHQLE